MARVTGIGGVFFRSRDPDALKACYGEHLGADADVLFRSEGPLVWGVFDGDTEHFGERSQSWMVNYRVDDLAGVLDRLQAAGVEPIRTEEEENVGSFAWANDPEGNRFELWQPVEGL